MGWMMRTAPMMMTCGEFEEFLDDWLDGSLPPRQRRIFDLHTKLCAPCRAYLAEYRCAVELGRRAFEDPSAPVPEDVPEDLVQAILAARRAE